MSNSDDLSIFQTVDDYLTGKLDAEERSKFENAMAVNPSLRKEVEIHKELIRSIEVGALGEKLQHIHSRRESRNKQSRRAYWALAASLSLFVAIGAWILNQKSDTDRLFAQYGAADPGLPVPMSATANYDFYDAMVDYKKGDYPTALQKFETLDAQKPGNDTLNYYLGAAHFGAGAYTEAIRQFKKDEVTTSPVFGYKAQWYEVLCLLKLNNLEAISKVEPAKESPFYLQIQAIQHELENAS